MPDLHAILTALYILCARAVASTVTLCFIERTLRRLLALCEEARRLKPWD